MTQVLGYVVPRGRASWGAASRGNCQSLRSCAWVQYTLVIFFHELSTVSPKTKKKTLLSVYIWNSVELNIFNWCTYTVYKYNIVYYILIKNDMYKQSFHCQTNIEDCWWTFNSATNGKKLERSMSDIKKMNTILLVNRGCAVVDKIV